MRIRLLKIQMHLAKTPAKANNSPVNSAKGPGCEPYKYLKKYQVFTDTAQIVQA
jgi:hypothetical protein